MGRGRLRRGYSLEVIFEEDSDLGSALNSLDSFAVHANAGKSKRSSIQEEFSTQEDYCAESHSRDSSTHLNFSPLLTLSSSSVCSNNLTSRRGGPRESTSTGHHSLATFADSSAFKSLDGFLQTSDMDACYIEWDDFPGDSLMSKTGAGCGDIEARSTCSNGNGRRSRVSRRQIVEANWLIDDEEDGDGDHDHDRRSTGPSSVYCPPPPPININPILTRTPAPARVNVSVNANPEPEAGTDMDDIFGERAAGFTAADAAFFDHDHEPFAGSGGSASLLLTDETYAAIDTFDDVNSTISTTTTAHSLSSSAGINLNGSSDKLARDSGFSPSASSATTTSSKNSNSVNINYERSNLNSSVSPASSLSLSSPRANINANAKPKQEIMQQKSSSTSTDSDSHSPTPMPDVKRVRALFENSCNNLSEPETTTTNSSSSPFSTWKKGPSSFLKKTCSQLLSTSKTSLLSVEDRSGSDMNLSTSSRRSSTTSMSTSSPLIRSAYSQLQLNQLEKYEFVDLLVNDNIIIEDSPDLFQKQRSRFQDMNCVKASQSNRLTSDSSNRHSSLRRSKSLGGGLHKKDNYDADDSSSNEDVRKSRPCILAEELPAPDTVKNVRNVFEKLLYKKTSSSDQPTVIITPSHHKSNAYTNSIESSAKKSLSSVKSNPTSKILRSESMRGDSIKCSRYGKPILLNGHSPPLPALATASATVSSPKAKELQENKAKKVEALRNGVHKNLVNGTGNARKPVESMTTEVKRENTNRQVQRRAFEIGKRADSFPTFSQHRSDSHYHRAHEPDSLLSLGSSLGTTVGDDEEPRMISPDVLNRIRSCGTTTTYFGGEIVAKTVHNRNLILPPPKLEANARDEVDFAVAPPSDVIFTARPNQKQTSPKCGTPAPDRQSNHASSRNGSGIDFTSFRFMDFESPSSRLSRPPDDEDIPRIISVEPKSQPNSPTKSNSPIGTLMGSIIEEGRNSPEGCESNASVSPSLGPPEREQRRTEAWINKHENAGAEDTPTASTRKKGDGNNNCIKPPASVSASVETVTNGHSHDHNDDDEKENSVASSKKFSEAAEGAWF